MLQHVNNFYKLETLYNIFCETYQTLFVHDNVKISKTGTSKDLEALELQTAVLDPYKIWLNKVCSVD